MPEKALKKIGAIKIHANILINNKRYKEALTVLDKANDLKRDIDVLQKKLKCNCKLRYKEAAVLVYNQITAEERLKPEIAVEIAYMHVDFRQSVQAEKAITNMPNYFENLQLSKGLLQVYSNFNEYDNIDKLVNRLVTPEIKEADSFKVVYTDALFNYQGDAQIYEQYRSKAIENLLSLINKKLKPVHSKKVFNLILKHKLNNPKFDVYVQSYLENNPHDAHVNFSAAENKDKLKKFDELLINTKQNINAIRGCLHDLAQNFPYEVWFKCYNKFLEYDPDKQDCASWAHFANMCVEYGYIDESIPIFLELIEIHPNYTRLYTGLAWAYRFQDKKKEKKILWQGHKACPGDDTIVLMLATVLEREGKFHQVIFLLTKFVEAHPDIVKTKLKLAYVHMEVGAVTTAEKLVSNLLQESPDNAEVIVALGECLTRANKFSLAHKHFINYSKNPNYWKDFAASHANVFEQEGKFEDAYDILNMAILSLSYHPDSYISMIRFFTRAIKQNKPFSNEKIKCVIDEALKRHPKQIQVLLSVGYYYLDCREYTKAIEYGTSALQLDPIDPNVKNLINNANRHLNSSNSSLSSYEASHSLNEIDLFKMGKEFIEQDQGTLAGNILSKLQTLYPKSRTTFHFAAKYFLYKNDHSSAEDNINLIKKNFYGLTAFEILTLVDLNAGLRNWQPAQSQLQEILKEDPLNIFALRQLGYCYICTEQYDAAKEVYNKILKEFHNDYHAVTSLAEIAYKESDNVLALKFLEQSEKQNPNNIKRICLKILVLSEFEQYEEALNLGNMHLSIKPMDRELLKTMFYLHYKLNDLERAKRCLDVLTKYYPEHRAVILCLIRYKLLVEKESAFDEVEVLFKKIRKAYWFKKRYEFEHVKFKMRSIDEISAIDLFEKHMISGWLYNYAPAYCELAMLYINANQLNNAENTYKKGIEKFPANVELHLQYFKLMVFSKTIDEKVLALYRDCIQKFNKKDSVVDTLNQCLYLAGLEKLIDNSSHIDTVKELTHNFQGLKLNSSKSNEFTKTASEIMYKISEKGYEVYFMGNGPKLYYYSKNKPDNNYTLNDLEFITDAPLAVINNIFESANKNAFTLNQINFKYQNYAVDINCIGPLMLDLGGYLKSLCGLGVDCLLMDKDKNILDPTGVALKHLASNVLAFVNDQVKTCQQNPVLLFRMIRHIHAFDSKIETKLLQDRVLSKMARYLSQVTHKGKITSEMLKLLYRGQGEQSIKTLLKHDILKYINPDLNTLLKDPQFQSWFYDKLRKTDQMVNNVKYNLRPNKFFVKAAYFIASILLRQNLKLPLHDFTIDDIFYDHYGSRIQMYPVRNYIHFFYAELKHSNCDFKPKATQFEEMEIDVESISEDEEFKLDSPVAQKILQDYSRRNESSDTSEVYWSAQTHEVPENVQDPEDVPKPLITQASNASPTSAPELHSTQVPQAQASSGQSTISYLYSLLPSIPSPVAAGQGIYNFVAGYMPSWSMFSLQAQRVDNSSSTFLSSRKEKSSMNKNEQITNRNQNANRGKKRK
ncbi:MAG: hypothetical protein JSS07_05970 [Proteobacteria bacterium]|nr:hypothetical protein [Pseudomonadota bacterium]